MTPGLDLALLLGAAVLLVAVGAVRLSTRLGVPSLLVYLALGVVIGEAGLGIRFDDVELTRTLGFCALIVIIAEGGLTARWSALRPVLGLAAALSTVGRGRSASWWSASPYTCCWVWTGGWRCSTARCSPPPTRRPSSPPCVGCVCRPGWWPPWRPSRA